MIDANRCQLSAQVLDLSRYLVSLLQRRLAHIPPNVLSLPSYLTVPAERVIPSAIVPVLSGQPRSLYAYLYARRMNTRPITWPTVPKGKDRVRICLHAGNTRNEVERLVDAMVGWAQGMMSAVAKANL
jgi:8-amino-7-oxononanoate synthase